MARISPGFVGGSSLERELQAMMRQAPQQRTPRTAEQIQRAAAPAAVEAPKMNGVRMNSNGTITINDTTYSRAEFRAKLQEIVETMQSDPASPYRDRKNPNHQQTVEEISLAYKFLNNELSPQDETEIVQDWRAAEETTEVTDALLPHQEIAQIVGTPEGRIALQRARTGQPLDARQAAIVKRHDELEATNNTQARKEQAGSGGTFSTRRPYAIPRELFDLERITDSRERAMAIRELQSRWRDDKNSDFNNVNSPNHKNAVAAMSRLYEAGNELPQPEDENR